MSECCCPPPPSSNVTAARCPESGTPGVSVSQTTVKALLTETALSRYEAGEFRFCPEPNCDVVYVDTSGQRFTVAEVRVPVGQKSAAATRPVCYSFGETEESIGAEIRRTGQSLAAERIRAHIEAGRCACDVRNPRGACCLGEVIALVRRLQADRGGVAEPAPRTDS
jgi:hypothetical protein